MGDVITAGDLLWPLRPPCGDDGPDDIDPGLWVLAQQVAVEWLWALSGRKYGLFPVVFRPEWTNPAVRAQCCFGSVAVGSFVPGFPIGFAPTKPTTVAPLPGPVSSITEVLVNDEVVASGGYIVEGDNLIRTDGGTWPAYQDTGLALTEAGTWQITYLRGITVPAAGQYAAGVLACEEGKRMVGQSCRLPNNTSLVTRNGKTVSLDAKQLQQAFTGIREVDQWARTVNPKGRMADPFVWSPDLDPAYRRPIPTSTTA